MRPRMQRLVQLQKELYIMNNYCKHLKKRKNKPYCNIIKKEIPFFCCQECDNKEYRIPVKGKIVKPKIKENSSYKKSDIMISKRTINIQNSANTQNKNNTCTKTAKMKNKSKKLAKLERDRFSVFTDDLKICYLCGKPKNDLHELLEGRNRINSIKFGYVIPVCRLCHSQIQNNTEFKNVWAKKAQEHFEENIGSRDEFLSIFRKNYLE